jgi:hypothetical protein
MYTLDVYDHNPLQFPHPPSERTLGTCQLTFCCCRTGPTRFGGNSHFLLPTTGACAASKPIGRLGRRPPAGRPEPATVLLDDGVSRPSAPPQYHFVRQQPRVSSRAESRSVGKTRPLTGPGGSSEVRTRYERMVSDHHTASLRGDRAGLVILMAGWGVASDLLPVPFRSKAFSDTCVPCLRFRLTFQGSEPASTLSGANTLFLRSITSLHQAAQLVAGWDGGRRRRPEPEPGCYLSAPRPATPF